MSAPAGHEATSSRGESAAEQRPWTSVLVVAAHPDDETIGAGGLIAASRAASVVHLTDGAPRDPRFWPTGLTGTREEYARVRRAELEAALRQARVRRATVVSLGAADQEAAFEARALVDSLVRILLEARPALLVTHPYEGGHPDHDTAALVARAAVTLIGREDLPAPILLEMTSYHLRDQALETGTFLEGAREREVVRSLSAALRARKERMLAAFATQRTVLQPFGVEAERFRRAPRYDFGAPPHAGPLLYEKRGFPLDGVRWRALAATTLRQLGLSRMATCGHCG